MSSLLFLQKNIVHRDLKLGNLVLNRRTHRVTITNFCLGKHLCSENDLLKDQRGSPAYISPDVLCGKPYLGEQYGVFCVSIVLRQLERMCEHVKCKYSG
jgi:serine/threonine-protein kinase 40